MKKIKISATAILISAIAFYFISSPDEPIVKQSDYLPFLINSVAVSTSVFDNDLFFWEKKLDSQPNNTTYKRKLAGLLSQRFRKKGTIKDILNSDLLLKSTLDRKLNLAASYQALSANAITQHEFKLAQFYAEEALEIGERKDLSTLLLFDANLELGDINTSAYLLNQQVNKTRFDYLTRAAKLSDAQGDLDKAILLMESALDRVRDNQRLHAWALSNLADMYGHAGKIEKSYETYLKVLSMDHEHLHSLQGIAWIAFSNDNNTSAAIQILNYIRSQKETPDVLLTLSDIALENGDYQLSDAYKTQFLEKTSQTQFGAMYNKYLIEIYASMPKTQQLALKMAKQEVINRPNALVYDLLAWSHFSLGNFLEAIRIAKEHVEGVSFEPNVIFHLGKYYAAVGEKRTAKKYFKQSLESQFELGPLITQQVRNELNK